MPGSDKFLSKDGLTDLKEDEGDIPGLYDDPSGYCTFGVGHLVHTTNKWPCFFKKAAGGEDFKAKVKTKWPNKTYATDYVQTSAKHIDTFDTFKSKAVDEAKAHIATAKFEKGYDQLDTAQKAKVDELATAAVDAEAGLLGKQSSEVLKTDVKPFERTVRTATKDLAPTQEEFDALVSFCFNVGQGNFNKSTLLTKIKEGKHLTGTADERKTAIDAIAAEFAKWNKSGGKVLTGLTTRRKKEADAYLKRARDELKTLKQSQPGADGPEPQAPAPKVNALEPPLAGAAGAVQAR